MDISPTLQLAQGGSWGPEGHLQGCLCAVSSLRAAGCQQLWARPEVIPKCRNSPLFPNIQRPQAPPGVAEGIAGLG